MDEDAGRARPCVPAAGCFPRGERVELAVGFFGRMRGLVGRPRFADALILAPCRDVHTWGMRVPLDIAFADREGRILQVHRFVAPRRRLRNGKASFVIERIAREGDWLAAGDRMKATWERMGS